MWSIDNESGMEAANLWVADLLSRINEGGLWGIPRAYTVYQFWPSRKEYAWEFGTGDEAVERVRKELGYTHKTP